MPELFSKIIHHQQGHSLQVTRPPKLTGILEGLMALTAVDSDLVKMTYENQKVSVLFAVQVQGS